MTDKPLEVIAGSEDRPLILGDVEIPCYVVQGEIRVITQAGMLRGLGRSPYASSQKTDQGGLDKLPSFLGAQNLSQFISDELRGKTNPVVFEIHPGAPPAYGHDAELLPMICQVYLEARRAGVLRANQLHVAERAEILIEGLALIGIIGLIDEATGYQEMRDKDALAKILEAFIAKELQPWTFTFPYEFYEHIFRLKGWGRPEGVKRPSVIGHYTNDIVYSRLPKGVLAELQDKNPVLPKGYRQNQHHRWLTPDLGHPKLREHLAGIIALMRAAPNWGYFYRSLQRAFPKKDETHPMHLGDE